MLEAEFVDAPEDLAEAIQRFERLQALGSAGIVGIAEQPESFLGEREEDVVLAGEVSVDGGGAVFDAFGDFPNGDVLVALGDEQLAGGVQNRPAHRFAISLVTFLDSHELIIF